MKQRNILFATLFCVLLLSAIPAAAAVLVIGQPADPSTGNEFPFGGEYSGEYQQVYSSTQFGGPITINDLEFYNTAYDSGATSLGAGNLAISLSTTTADWNTLSGTFANNIGGDNTVVFNSGFSQSWAFGDTLHILLTTPFTYDPADGNLLMDVVVSGASGGTVFFDTNSGNTFIGRVYCPNGIACDPGTVEQGYGLVTGFSSGTTVVPEPGLFVAVGLALVGMGRAIRRRTR